MSDEKALDDFLGFGDLNHQKEGSILHPQLREYANFLLRLPRILKNSFDKAAVILKGYSLLKPHNGLPPSFKITDNLLHWRYFLDYKKPLPGTLLKTTHFWNAVRNSEAEVLKEIHRSKGYLAVLSRKTDEVTFAATDKDDHRKKQE
tara:strand:- start:468 stop:908 length:441 start_codon:yes stop_codon:yes gene_type:complete